MLGVIENDLLGFCDGQFVVQEAVGAVELW